MRLRSLLFVPGDRPERFAKAAASGADALILDLEDSVALERKDAARDAVRTYLAGRRSAATFVRLNPLESEFIEDDLVFAVRDARPDGLVLPKAEGAASVAALAARVPGVPIVAIATETPAAMFQLGTYAQVSGRLAGLTWGAEDLPAAIGASSNRDDSGLYVLPLKPEDARKDDIDRFRQMKLFRLDDVFGNWKDAQAKHLGAGGIYDSFAKAGR